MSNYKEYKIDNSYYYFNHYYFNDLFRYKKRKEKININELEENLSNTINVSVSAIHNWRNSNYSPNDIDIIKNISKFFDLDDYKLLLKKKGENNMNKLSELKLLSIKRIYDSIMDYLEYFRKTNGYNDIWFDLECEPKQREDKLYEIAENKIEKVILVFKKEWLILKDEDVYDEIGNMIYNDLYDTFDGKLSYAYRFEADGENGITTNQDIEKITIKLQSIIEKYC